MLVALIDSEHDLAARFPLPNQIGDTLGGILEIAEEDDARVARAKPQACRNRRLGAKISREADVLPVRVLFADCLRESTRIIVTRVVDQQTLEIIIGKRLLHAR